MTFNAVSLGFAYAHNCLGDGGYVQTNNSALSKLEDDALLKRAHAVPSSNSAAAEDDDGGRISYDRFCAICAALVL